MSNNSDFNEILPLSSDYDHLFHNRPAIVLINGEIRRGFLLNSNFYVDMWSRERIVSSRFQSLIQNITFTTGSEEVFSTCLVCQENEKKCRNICSSCNNCHVCAGCLPALVAGSLTSDDISVAPNQHDNPVIFKCPLCRNIVRRNAVTINNIMELHL